MESCACCPRQQAADPPFGGARPDIVVARGRPLPDPVPWRPEITEADRARERRNLAYAGRAAPAPTPATPAVDQQAVIPALVPSSVTVVIDEPVTENKREEKKQTELPIQKIWDKYNIILI